MLEPWLEELSNYFFWNTCEGTLIGIDQNLNHGSLDLDFVFRLVKNKRIDVEIGFESTYGANYYSNQLNVTISKSF